MSVGVQRPGPEEKPGSLPAAEACQRRRRARTMQTCNMNWNTGPCRKQRVRQRTTRQNARPRVHAVAHTNLYRDARTGKCNARTRSETCEDTHRRARTRRDVHATGLNRPKHTHTRHVTAPHSWLAGDAFQTNSDVNPAAGGTFIQIF